MFRKIATLSALLLSLTSLVACGGSDRDEPFQPGTSSTGSSNQPSQGAAINNKLVFNGVDPLLPFGEGKQIIILREFDEFRRYFDAYANDFVDTSELNFETGQVVLIDEGYVNKCNESVTFQRFEAFELSNNTARVSVTYRDFDKPAVSSSVSSGFSESSSSSVNSNAAFSDCTNQSPVAAKKRNFRFQYVNTRKTITVEEKVTYQ